jgi:hypothetical protein
MIIRILKDQNMLKLTELVPTGCQETKIRKTKKSDGNGTVFNI